MAEARRDLRFAEIAPFGPGKRLNVPSSEAVRLVALNFTQNVDRAFHFAHLFPFLVFATGRNERIYCAAYFKVTGTIEPVDLTQEQEKNIRQEMARISDAEKQGWREQGVFDPTMPAHEEFFHDTWTYGNHNLRLIVGTTALLEPGLEVALAAHLMWHWTAFEALATDLWVVAVDNGPKDFAERVLTGQFSKTRSDKPEKMQEKSISPSVLKRYGYDLRESMGELLRELKKVDFQSLANIKRAYEAAFGEDINRVFAGGDFRHVQLVESVRNLYAHQAGTVDKSFKDQVDDLPEYAALKIGEPFPIDGVFCASMADIICRVGVALIGFVDERLPDLSPEWNI